MGETKGGDTPHAALPSPTKYNLRLDDVTVRLLRMEVLTDPKEDYETRFKASFETALRVEEPERFSVVLKFSLRFRRSQKPNPFRFRCELEGFFGHKSGVPKELRDYYEKVNATVYLWPYLRELVHDSAARTGFPSFILGTLDVREFVERRTRELGEANQGHERPAEKPK